MAFCKEVSYQGCFSTPNVFPSQMPWPGWETVAGFPQKMLLGFIDESGLNIMKQRIATPANPAEDSFMKDV
jgi:hypothetical protein